MISTNKTMKCSVAALLTVLTMALSGCGMATSTGSSASNSPVPARTLNGNVHGGQQPVAGATIQIYAVGMTGLKSAATPLIYSSSPVTTNANGTFSVTGDWDCTSNTAVYGSNPLIYIVATQGNPGLTTPGANNAALSMMTAWGSCNSFTSTSFVSINEGTTVAAAYALAPFMADYAHVGAVGANATGLVNAFATARVLADPVTGSVPGSLLPANATAPVAEIDTLANIVSRCVNSSGTDGNCSNLFSAVTPTGGTKPTDTIGALLSIANNPGNNPSGIFGADTGGQAPFQPNLTSSPNDWTLALNFTGGGLNAPVGVAIDAGGNAWVANAGGNSVTELSGIGTLLTGSTGYTGNNTIFGAQGIAVDKSGNVWVADTLLSSVLKLTVSGGAVQSSASYSGGGINGPIGIAIDSQNNVWVSNFDGGSVTELNSSGTAVGGSPLTAGGALQAPFGIAIDSMGNVWTADTLGSSVFEFANSQTVLSSTPYADDAVLSPLGVALDARGHAWIADSGTNSVSLFNAAGAALLTTPWTGGGLAMPTAIAIDGQGTAWVANTASLAELAYGQSAPLSPAAGFGTLNQPSGIAIDASGSVWTANSGDNSVSEFIGLASPAATPLATKTGP